MKWVIMYKMSGLRENADKWRFYGRCSDEYTANGIVRDMLRRGHISDCQCVEVAENDRKFFPESWQ